MPLAKDFKQLRVYATGFDAAMRIFELSKSWPKDERYSLTDQIRRSSRSVCGNIAEAWRKRLYVPHFVSKLSDANAEAAETQVWLNFARECGYLDETAHAELDRLYHQIGGGLVKMITEDEAWCGPAALREESASYHTGPNGYDDFDNPPPP
jgi:four helix bundle protein